MKKINLSTWSIPLSILVLCFLSFGLLLPWLGFYWDDWNFIYSYHVFGPGGFGAFLAADRPAAQYFFAAITSLFRDFPLAYQVFTLTLRALTALALWWLINNLWPGKAKRLVWVPFLFVVYPAFIEQPIALTYSNHWAGYLCQMVSFSLMVVALRRPARYWAYTLAALALQTSVFAIDYHYGLEYMRPLMLWFIIGETMSPPGKRLGKTVLYWLPYLPVTGFYILWRAVLFKSYLYDPGTVSGKLAKPLAAVLGLAQTVLQDFFKTSLTAWTGIFASLTSIHFETVTDWFYWGLILATAALAGFYFYAQRRQLQADESDGPSPAGQAVILGVWAMLVAGIPFVISLFPHSLEFPYERFTLPFMLGVSFLSGGVIELLLRTYRQKAVIVVILVSFAVGAHFETANTFRREWENQGQFFWQLNWRAPAIRPGTLLLTYDLPFQYDTDYSLTAPLNWMYAPQQASGNLPYLLFLIKARLGNGGLETLRLNTPVYKDMRSFSFSGSTSQTLLFFYSPPGCLRILDPARPEEWHNLPQRLMDAGQLARPDLVETGSPTPARPPKNYFNPEPAHQWCYDFEKADLARQAQDWAQVASLGNAALKLPEQAQETSEYFVFIEGFAKAGQASQAGVLSKTVLAKDPTLKPNLCSLWRRLGKDQNLYETSLQQRQALACPAN